MAQPKIEFKLLLVGDCGVGMFSFEVINGSFLY